jgi:FliI/YscN family ATPase
MVVACGVVERAEGGLLVARLPRAAIGDGVAIEGGPTGEVRRIDGAHAHIAVHGAIEGIAAGTSVRADSSAQHAALGTCALGRAIDARGRPLDAGPPLAGLRVRIAPLQPVRRAPIDTPLWTGIRAIDALLTLGVGSRTGVFGAPGSGKTTILEMLARGCAADAIVLALVGERGREAQAWIARCDRRTTVVCAGSDRPAAERLRCVRVALAHACALRERGLDVLVLLDSLARAAAALRELAVANGESVGRGGFPPSVFADLARIVEVGGAAPNGSITLVATVLDDGDERDPVSDAARSLLDGHLQLSPLLARGGRFPALDVPASASRTMQQVCDAQQLHAARVVRGALADLERSADARSLGVAIEGEAMQRAVRCERQLEAFLRQDAEPHDPLATLAMLLDLAHDLEE